MVYEKFNFSNGGYIERILSPDLEKDLKERVQLEQEIVDYSKYIWGDNSTEYLVGLLSSISTTKQLEVLVNNLKDKIKQGDME